MAIGNSFRHFVVGGILIFYDMFSIMNEAKTNCERENSIFDSKLILFCSLNCLCYIKQEVLSRSEKIYKPILPYWNDTNFVHFVGLNFYLYLFWSELMHIAVLRLYTLSSKVSNAIRKHYYIHMFRIVFNNRSNTKEFTKSKSYPINNIRWKVL